MCNPLLGFLPCTLSKPCAMSVFKWKMLCWCWTLHAYIDAFWPVWAGRESNDLNSRAWISVKTFTQLRSGISPVHRKNSWSCEMLSNILLPEGATWGKTVLEITFRKDRYFYSHQSAGAELWRVSLPFVEIAIYQNRTTIIIIKYCE